jgi:hypothetical protein
MGDCRIPHREYATEHSPSSRGTAMAPRYSVRATGQGRYCVWDTEKDAIARSPDGSLQYADLSLQLAFDVIDQLTEQDDK